MVLLKIGSRDRLACLRIERLEEDNQASDAMVAGAAAAEAEAEASGAEAARKLGEAGEAFAGARDCC